MAINYWEQAGKPTSYNPLAPGYVNSCTVEILKVYVLTFKAKSPTNARLEVVTGNAAYFAQNITQDFVEYTAIADKVIANSNVLYFLDVNGAGNIVVKDVKLIQKPLGRAAINGIDGFLSGKWALHANAKAIDNETLELNATADIQVSKLSIPVEPNTTYILNMDNSQYAKSQIDEFDVGNVKITNGLKTQSNAHPFTFTTKSNTTRIEILLYNYGITSGTHTFKRPMLNLGPIPAPYEPKRGERMVMPITAGKNLINSALYEQGSMINTNDKIVSTIRLRNYPTTLRRGSIYTATIPSGHKVYMRHYGFGSIYEEANSGWINGPATYSFTARDEVGMIVAKIDESTITLNEIPSIQLEEGETATPYESYRVQTSRKVNQRPKVYKSTANFVGKVLGSRVENPNVMKVDFHSTLKVPTAFQYEDPYTNVVSLNGSTKLTSTLTNTLISQQLFSFDLITWYERNIGPIPRTTVADKVQYLKDNLSRLTANWHGFGSGPSGNKANISWWNQVAVTWSTPSFNTSATVSKIVRDNAITSAIDPNGLVHYLVYAEPSDGVTASTINTDYVELEIETKEVVVPGVRAKIENGVPKKNLIDESLLVNNSDINISTGLQNAGSRTVPTNFIPVKPNTTYTFQRPISSGNVGFRTYRVDKVFLTSISFAWTFTTASDVYFIKFIDEANTLTKGYQLEEGTTATKYEPYKEVSRPANLPVRQAFR